MSIDPSDALAYASSFNATTTVSHEVWQGSPTSDAHGNAISTYAPAVERVVMCIYPLHRLPHADPVTSDYMSRYMADFVMEVPDALVYSKNDQVTWNGDVYLVEGLPFNWGDNNPFGFDITTFGGSVYIRRVT